MGKKRDRDAVGREDAEPKDTKMDESSDEEDFNVVNVDFEWFNFDPQIDFHGTKTLLRQLLDVDSPLIPTSPFADLILSQPTVGSTVKVDGKANDAYAMLTALNLAAHRDHEAIKPLSSYLIGKTASNPKLEHARSVLERASRGETQLGLVLSERLINMPVEVAPPMYTCLIDELEAAVEDGEPYEFEYFLILSKVYREVQSTLDEGERKAKKAKEDGGSMFYFHPEDEMFARHAVASGTFAYSKEDEANADSKRAFQEMGVKCEGFVVLIEGKRFGEAVAAVAEYVKGPGQ